MAKACLGAGGRHFTATRKQCTLNYRGNRNSKLPADVGFECSEIKQLALET